jgi:hypothetical protein
MLAASLKAYPVVAVLVCGGLSLVLILRRIFELDKAVDDPARIEATRPLIVQEAEQETSWNYRAEAVLGHVFGEAVCWGVFGLLYLAAGERANLLVALIVFGGLFSVVMWRRVGAAATLGFLIVAAVCLVSFFPVLTQTPSAQSMPTVGLSYYRNDVIQIQQRLIELGFLPESFFPEGNWGPMSQQALLEFKKQSGLGSSNTWDFTTRRALFSGQAKHALSP